MNEFLSEKAIELKAETEKILKEESPKFLSFMQQAEFPFYIMAKLKHLKLSGIDLKGYGGLGLSFLDICAILYEVARWDASLGTFFMIQNTCI
mmetsp:Transcript_44171/g.42899  ORF Transcript_44171/g.42899 Transcript_44171/m.42899 type:complete len:93 (+) Transcript_44171:94-372(+)